MKKFPNVLVFSTLFFALTASAYAGDPVQQANMIQQDSWMEQSEQSSDQHIHHVRESGKFPGILIRPRAKIQFKKAERKERKGNHAQAAFHRAKGIELLDRKSGWHAHQILKNEHMAAPARAANDSYYSDRYTSSSSGKGGQVVQQNVQQSAYQDVYQEQDVSQWSKQELDQNLEPQPYGQLLSETYEIYDESSKPTQGSVSLPPNGVGQEFGKDTVLVDEKSADDQLSSAESSSKKPLANYPVAKPIVLDEKPAQDHKPDPIVVADPVIVARKPTVPQRQQMTQKPKAEILLPKPIVVSNPLPEKLPLQAQTQPSQIQEGKLEQEVDCDKLGKSEAKRCKEGKIRRLGKRIARRDAKTDRLVSKRDRLEADCLDSKISKDVCVKQAGDLEIQENKAAKGLISKLFGSKSKHDKLENNPAVSTLTAQPIRTEIIPTGFGPVEVEVLPNSPSSVSGAL
jgi:hypothetical protein